VPLEPADGLRSVRATAADHEHDDGALKDGEQRMDVDFGELGLAWDDAVLVVLSAVGIYLVIIALCRSFGQRSIASLSSFDLAVTVALGAIIGRVTLARVSLVAGVLGLVTLFSTEALVRLVRNRTRMGLLIDSRPVVVLLHGRMLEDELRRHGLSSQDVHAQIRHQGIGSMEDVAVVVLERNGSMSVVPEGTRIGLDMFVHVKNIDEHADDLGPRRRRS
jgi:uncharacterized membrane protein YcaP (DUF421 family)